MTAKSARLPKCSSVLEEWKQAHSKKQKIILSLLAKAILTFLGLHLTNAGLDLNPRPWSLSIAI